MIKKSKFLISVMMVASLAMTACTISGDMGSKDDVVVKPQATIIQKPSTETDLPGDDITEPDIQNTIQVSEYAEDCDIPYYYYEDEMHQYYEDEEVFKDAVVSKYGIVRIKEDSEYNDLAIALNGYAKGVEDYADEFISSYYDYWLEDYASIQENMPDYEIGQYYNYDYSYVTRADDQLFSMSLYSASYVGGVHGNSWYSGITYDTMTGNMVFFEDIVEDADEVISFITDSLYEKYEEDTFFAETKEDLKEEIAQYFYDNNISFYVTKEGVTIVFSPYAIAPFSSGSPNIEIRYDEHPELLKDEYFTTYLNDYVIKMAAGQSYSINDNGTIRHYSVFNMGFYVEGYGYSDEFSGISINNEDNYELSNYFDQFSCLEPDLYLIKKSGKYYIMSVLYDMDGGAITYVFKFENGIAQRNDDFYRYFVNDFTRTDVFEIGEMFYFGDYAFIGNTLACINENGEIVLLNDVFQPVYEYVEGIQVKCKTDVEALKIDVYGKPTDETVTIKKGSVFTPAGYTEGYYLFYVGDDTVAMEYDMDGNYNPTYNGIVDVDLFNFGY